MPSGGCWTWHEEIVEKERFYLTNVQYCAIMEEMDTRSKDTDITKGIEMDVGDTFEFDEIGYWSEIKLDIVREYAKAYSKILSKQPGFHHVYIDAFSGAGVHLSKTTGELVPGSPLNALWIEPPFKEHFLIDIDGDKIKHLRSLIADRGNVHLFEGDCNDILIGRFFHL